MTRESVRLIAPIGLNMFCIHITYWKPLKFFSDTTFGLSVLRNSLNMAFFAVFKAFISQRARKRDAPQGAVPCVFEFRSQGKGRN